MSIQRRLLVYLLLCAPLVWVVALVIAADRARHEVNELFDTGIIRLARQVQVMLPGFAQSHAPARDAPVAGAVPVPAPAPAPTSTHDPVAMPTPGSIGEADFGDLALAVWDGAGRLLHADREGAQLPRRADAAGFVDFAIGGEPWHVYYLQSPHAEWLVATGQKVHERDELVRDLVASQLLPWLLVLPLLLLAMTWSVRRALAPVRALAVELQGRAADALQPVSTRNAPVELQPLLQAMNGLFTRIDATLARERRFTADAAHELRTPLAVLRAQWDVLRGSGDATARSRAEANLSAGLDRMDRLVSQMLVMSRLEATERLSNGGSVHWETLVEQVTSDVLPLAERRGVELACEWPADDTRPFPLRGDGESMAILVRNLLDNAVRYAPHGSVVTLRFDASGLAVENEGAALPAATLQRLGERFHRGAEPAESGSGLGVSIAQRIAELHGLALRYRTRENGSGVVAELRAT